MKNNLRDKKVIYTLIIALLLIGLHIWQYVKSGHDSRALINLVMCSVFVPLIIFCGMSCLPYFLLAYCYIYLPFEEYDNYTSLFLLCSAISLNKRLRLSFCLLLKKWWMWYQLLATLWMSNLLYIHLLIARFRAFVTHNLSISVFVTLQIAKLIFHSFFSSPISVNNISLCFSVSFLLSWNWFLSKFFILWIIQMCIGHASGHLQASSMYNFILIF